MKITATVENATFEIRNDAGEVIFLGTCANYTIKGDLAALVEAMGALVGKVSELDL